MKHIGFMLLLLAVALSATSCTRQYVCVCTSSWTNQQYEETIHARNRDKARKYCEEKNAPEVDGPRDCHLK